MTDITIRCAQCRQVFTMERDALDADYECECGEKGFDVISGDYIH